MLSLYTNRMKYIITDDATTTIVFLSTSEIAVHNMSFYKPFVLNGFTKIETYCILFDDATFFKQNEISILKYVEK